MAFDDDIDPSIAALLADTQDEIPEVELNVPKKMEFLLLADRRIKTLKILYLKKRQASPK